MKRPLAPVAAIAAFAAATPAMAHPGHDLGTGFVAGFVHPFTGMDHLTAMVAVGLWSARAYRRTPYVLPIAFMAAMAAGFLLGETSAVIPAETIIAISLPLLAIGAAFAVRINLAAASGITALFAIGHGYAHASEATGGHAGFAVAMLAATALLHGVGLAAGRAWVRMSERRGTAKAADQS